jgi:hypothetical protein
MLKQLFIDELNAMRSILPDDMDVATSREYVNLGWECEIEILKAITSQLSITADPKGIHSTSPATFRVGTVTYLNTGGCTN